MVSVPDFRWEFSRKRGEKNDMGEPSIGARLTTLFSKAAYISQVVYKEIMEYTELCRGSSPDPY